MFTLIIFGNARHLTGRYPIPTKKLLFLTTTILDYAPFAKDERIWGLIVGCFHLLHSESVRREGVSIEQQQLWPRGDRQILAKKIELDNNISLLTYLWLRRPGFSSA